jgi:hypothetical protein
MNVTSVGMFKNKHQAVSQGGHKPEAGGSMLKETDTITFASSFSPQASSSCM